MGVVYHPNQVFSGKVPEADGFSHRKAAEYVFELLSGEELQQRLGILSVLIHGSVAEGRIKLRSDLDIVVAHGADSEDDSENLFKLIDELHAELQAVYGVILEASLPSLGQLESGSHGFDPLFVNYLQLAAEKSSFCDNNPVRGLEGIEVDQTPESQLAVLKILRDYAEVKADKFSSWRIVDQFLFDQRLLKPIQRGLELPSALGRKALGTFEFDSKTNSSDIAHQAHSNLFKEFNDRLIAFRAFQELVTLNKEYDELLMAAIDGDINAGEYIPWLQNKAAQVRKAAYTLSNMTIRAATEQISKISTDL